jgi:hypothetical protein
VERECSEGREENAAKVESRQQWNCVKKGGGLSTH